LKVRGLRDCLEQTREEVGLGERGLKEEEILRVFRDSEVGATVVEVCRKHGISQQSFYLWKKKCAGLGLNGLARVATASGREPRV
jgi:putative transposase